LEIAKPIGTTITLEQSTAPNRRFNDSQLPEFGSLRLQAMLGRRNVHRTLNASKIHDATK
jgi:hypothetical protein